jgi:FkbM family methyltransferase
MIRSQLTSLARFVARHRDARATRTTALFARRYLDAYENLDYDITTNGELRVLEVIEGIGPHCVFDVGANMGDWTGHVRRLLPRATVHCFELVPDTARHLALRFETDRQVVVHGVGLSDRSGTVTIHHYPARPDLSTMVAYPQPFETVALDVEVDVGDNYVDAAAVERIDLLKIDVEGAEHRVLRGFSSTFDAGRVTAVQFEYGRANIAEHSLLQDLYGLFEAYDFAVGKIYPTAVDFRQYRFEDEDFRGPNFLAVHLSRGDLIERLRA